MFYDAPLVLVICSLPLYLCRSSTHCVATTNLLASMSIHLHYCHCFWPRVQPSSPTTLSPLCCHHVAQPPSPITTSISNDGVSNLRAASCGNTQPSSPQPHKAGTICRTRHSFWARSPCKLTCQINFAAPHDTPGGVSP